MVEPWPPILEILPRLSLALVLSAHWFAHRTGLDPALVYTLRWCEPGTGLDPVRLVAQSLQLELLIRFSHFISRRILSDKHSEKIGFLGFFQLASKVPVELRLALFSPSDTPTYSPRHQTK